jgi:hypothetical protein
MTSHRLLEFSRRVTVALTRMMMTLLMLILMIMISGALAPALHAQALVASASVPDAPVPSSSPSPSPSLEPVTPVVTVASAPTFESTQHKFWDKQNSVLFLASAALNGADFVVTRANLQGGGQELNPLVRPFGTSTAGLAMNFIGETAGFISVSYFFHKTGHHKLERAVSLVNIGGSAGAVSYGLMHR